MKDEIIMMIVAVVLIALVFLCGLRSTADDNMTTVIIECGCVEEFSYEGEY